MTLKKLLEEYKVDIDGLLETELGGLPMRDKPYIAAQISSERGLEIDIVVPRYMS